MNSWRAAGLTLAFLAAAGATLATDWPLQDFEGGQAVSRDRLLGATLEYMFYEGKQYIHEGTDLPAIPYLDVNGGWVAEAPYAVVTVGGAVRKVWDSDDPEAENFLIIDGCDGKQYWYYHLAAGFTTGITDRFRQGEPVQAGEAIGQPATWGDDCDYTHLHYQIQADGGNTLLDPVSGLTPFNDREPPTIGPLHFCADDAEADAAAAATGQTAALWQEFVPVAPGGCAMVNGRVDIVAQIEDKHQAGRGPFRGDTIACRRVRYRVCDESQPDCPSWRELWDFKSMPSSWALSGGPEVTAHYSVRGQYASSSHYCGNDTFFVVPTNVSGGIADNRGAVAGGSITRSGAWDASPVSYAPPGLASPSPTGSSPNPAGAASFRSVAVEATDYGGNTTVRTAPVCVSDEDGTCRATKLLIRDCPDDGGGEPSNCPVWDDSPDILVNPDDATAGGEMLHDKVNVVLVCMRNAGCKEILPDTEIVTTLRWIPGLVEGPVASIFTEDRRVASGLEGPEGELFEEGESWVVGERRCSRVPLWTGPAAVGIGGDGVLEASVGRAGDEPNGAPTVRLDNNRAQKRYVTPDAVVAIGISPAGFPAPGRAEEKLHLEERGSWP